MARYLQWTPNGTHFEGGRDDSSEIKEADNDLGRKDYCPSRNARTPAGLSNKEKKQKRYLPPFVNAGERKVSVSRPIREIPLALSYLVLYTPERSVRMPFGYQSPYVWLIRGIELVIAGKLAITLKVPDHPGFASRVWDL